MEMDTGYLGTSCGIWLTDGLRRIKCTCHDLEFWGVTGFLPYTNWTHLSYRHTPIGHSAKHHLLPSLSQPALGTASFPDPTCWRIKLFIGNKTWYFIWQKALTKFFTDQALYTKFIGNSNLILHLTKGSYKILLGLKSTRFQQIPVIVFVSFKFVSTAHSLPGEILILELSSF